MPAKSGQKTDFDLSIVIVSYNTAKMTLECISSIIENYRDNKVQIILVDNNSQDGSADLVETSFPNVTLIRNNCNLGFATANNQGFKLCKGRHILLLNSDTLILGDVLQKTVVFLDSNQDIGAMGCQVLNQDRTIQNTCSGFPTLWRLIIMTLALDKVSCLSFLDNYLMRSWKRDKIQDVEVISGCYLVIRKNILKSVGNLDERFFFFGEETDWCKRIAESGWRTVFAPVGNIVHYGGASVKKLSHQRDILLTNAVVKLQKKYGGNLGGISAYCILMFFNISRWLFWSSFSIFTQKSKERAYHFKQVVKGYKKCWPTD